VNRHCQPFVVKKNAQKRLVNRAKVPALSAGVDWGGRPHCGHIPRPFYVVLTASHQGISDSSL
jgi:hypothetical protein